MASLTSPLYISEASPARIRGALVSMNGLLITGGQFFSYLINLAFTKVTSSLGAIRFNAVTIRVSKMALLTWKKSAFGTQMVAQANLGFWGVILLGTYVISYSPGMGTVPWIVNSEIYPLRYRGICGGIATVSYWVSNLIMSETFLTLTEALGSAGTFLLFTGFSFFGLIAIYFFVPETKGLQFEEVEQLLKKVFRPCCNKSKNVDSSS
ncbi:inositol transporter 4 [Actinidia rufa]|uniref:Inositol transporter 4 n=1 Tax=Actinidia rufa TaxID=165716 RepID=A0A7J0GEG0_9ERIC|nr:inositol transporter 4 [Actinidia rufa]